MGVSALSRTASSFVAGGSFEAGVFFFRVGDLFLSSGDGFSEDLFSSGEGFLGGGALEGDGGGAGDNDPRLGLRLGHRVHVGGDEETPLPTVG